ncbi:dihydropteroate synthase [endosymbiont of Lamellibrachia barhami]|uniref:dihydropteroate synthase n=1 Tax=endosymbiont of Lamellibrachia barhami TaxID=205975 RepID=UPI0015AE522D|nr:dihydropteroate synthase [endosymbiont of Lamellibrachia barhami]
MGILNVTPDSFSDGGRFTRTDPALRHALGMVEAGAAIVDIGGESTRPGASPVSEAQEIDRVVPLIERLSRELDVPISIDTSKPAVMREAVAAGAGLINDVQALQTEGALEAAAELAVPVCLMHMRGEPRTMQAAPEYADVVADVRDFLNERIKACRSAGIPLERLLVDPGFGFGKTLAHNLALLKNLSEFSALSVPLLVGISRKSMIGALLGDAPVDQRLYGSVAAGVLAATQGASIIRAHDIKATVDALRIAAAVMG